MTGLNSSDLFGRRVFLESAAAGSASVIAPSIPGASRSAFGQQAHAEGRAKACILIYLDGGPSHIDLLDMKPSAPREFRGPYQPISTSLTGVQVCEHLPRLATQMHRVTLIRSMSHDQTVHDPAVYQMLTGYPHLSSAGGLKVEASDLPHMASAYGAADHRPTVMPKVVELPETMHMEGRILPGQNAGILGPAHDPFRVSLSSSGELARPDFLLHSDMTRQRLHQRAQLRSSLRDRIESESPSTRFDEYYRQALDILEQPRIAEAFQLERESEEIRAKYGLYRHGQSVLLARRLVEAGARFVTVYWGREDQDWADGRGARPANNPWDTHRNHFPLVTQSLAPRADQTLAALLNDLTDRGLLDDTLVIWMGDFGRTPRISHPWASRDHWPYAFSLIVAGAGVPAGMVLGSTDSNAAFVSDGRVTPADLTATVFRLLGIDPRTRLTSSIGRPHRLSTGTPIRELLG